MANARSNPANDDDAVRLVEHLSAVASVFEVSEESRSGRHHRQLVSLVGDFPLGDVYEGFSKLGDEDLY